MPTTFPTHQSLHTPHPQRPPHAPPTCHSHILIGVQFPDLAGLVAGGSEDLRAVRTSAAGEDRCTVRLLCLHTGLASLVELQAPDLDRAGHGEGCKQGGELGSLGG